MTRILRRLLCSVAAVGLVLNGPVALPAAQAAPSPANGLPVALAAPSPANALQVALAAPSPAKIEDQIDEQWNKLEPVIESYNDVHNRLQKNRAQAKAIEKRLTPLEIQVNMALVQVRGLATDAYKQGSPGAINAMIMSGSATGLTEKLIFLDQYARHQREQIADVAELRDKLATDKRDLDVLTKSLAAQDTELASRKAGIEKDIDKLQKLRVQAYGPSGSTGGALRTGPCPVTYTNDKGGRAAQKACSLIGKPYIFGAQGPSGYDCSGLTLTAWATVGVRLDHYTKDQWGQGRPVSRAELKPGDLVFYYSDLHHMAMYVGGNTVVHAPHTGDRVRMASINRGPIAGYRRPA